MKKLLLSFYLFYSGLLHAQNVGIGTNTPAPSAILELNANNKGLLPPRMSTVQRDAIVSPATGLIVYDTDNNSLFLYNGTRWVSFDQTNTVTTSNGINPSYVFASPQFLMLYTTPNTQSSIYKTHQAASVSSNMIVTSYGVGNVSGNPFFVSWDINRNGTITQISHTLTQVDAINSVYCFDADVLDENIYAVINKALFRLNINNVADVVKIADNVGVARQLKVLANNDVILTTNLNNGSLIRVLPNGTQQIIASNLQAPNYFDIFNNNYFVTISSPLTGLVVKVTPAGVVTTVVSDIISPRSIVFDNNNNFVLQTNFTLLGTTYIACNLYDQNGQLIGPVNDNNDYAIFTNIGTLYVYSPLFVDSFNNLVFTHYTNATIQPPNPIGPNGIWLLKMIKLP